MNACMRQVDVAITGACLPLAIVRYSLGGVAQSHTIIHDLMVPNKYSYRCRYLFSDGCVMMVVVHVIVF